MSTLGQKPATQHVSTEKQTITGNGGTSYTLQQSVSQASDIEVFVNNTRQEPTVAYTANNTTLTMTGAVNSSDSFYVIFQGKAIQTAGLPVDAAITVGGTLTSTGNVTTSGTLNTPSINSGQIGGQRNLIHNGAMLIHQRGPAAFTGVSGSAYHMDRFRTGMGDTSARFTVNHATAGLNGFGKSLKFDCTTAESSLSNADARLFLSQRIEGQNLQQLKKGTSDAVQVTVSFYVKSTKTGTYVLEIVDTDNNRHISKSYTISSSGAWERKTLTFAGDTTGSLTNDRNTSLQLNWWLLAHTNYSSGTLQTTWSGYAGASDYVNSAVGQVNIGDNTSNTWEITGVQMEVGDQATEFEHITYAEELKRCSRYYQRHATITTFGPIGIGRAWSTSRMNVTKDLSVSMRVNPSLTASDFGHLQVAGISQNIDGIHNDGASGQKFGYNADCSMVKIGFGHSGAGFTTGTIYQAEFDNVAEGYIDLDSELT